jgi:hypothetical protein
MTSRDYKDVAIPLSPERVGEKASGWRTIESAPKDEPRVLLWGHELGRHENRHAIGYFANVSNPGWTNGELDTGWRLIEETSVGPDGDAWMTPIEFAPTHWMPLPDPPDV